VGVADTLYAKSTLLSMCRERGAEAIPYATLQDVTRSLEKPTGEGSDP